MIVFHGVRRANPISKCAHQTLLPTSSGASSTVDDEVEPSGNRVSDTAGSLSGALRDVAWIDMNFSNARCEVKIAPTSEITPVRFRVGAKPGGTIRFVFRIVKTYYQTWVNTIFEKQELRNKTLGKEVPRFV